MDRESYETIYGKGTKLFDLAWFQKNLHSESARGRVLIMAAFLEDMIARTLVSVLPPHPSTKYLLHGSNAPISSFSAKIALARSLGLINDSEYSNLDIVRKIRNEFAHVIECSFEHDKVRDLTSNLNYALGELDSNASLKPVGLNRFELASSALLLHLHDRADVAARVKFPSRPERET